MASTTSARAGSGRRYLRILWQWTVHDLRGRYGRGALRSGWAVVQPLFAVAVYVIVFGVIFDADTGDVPYLTYLLSGMVVFRVFSSAVSSSTCLSENLSTLRHLPMRKDVVPVARVFASLLDMAVVLVAFLVAALIQGADLRSTVVLAPLVLVPAVTLATAVCVMISTAQVFVPDVQFGSIVLTQLLFFASPISYHADDLPSWLIWLEWANPISVFIAAFRDLALVGGNLNWTPFVVHSLLAGALLVLAGWHLGAVEHRIVDVG